MFFGLVSSVIHLVSRSGGWSAELSSFACWEIVFLIRIPTPPPFLFLFLAIHLYPLMLICWFFSSLVSVIRATSAFVAVRSDSILVVLLLIPLTFTVIIVSCLFFLILGLFVGMVLLSWFSFLLGIILILMGPNVTFFLSGGSSGFVLGFLVPICIFSVPLVLVGVLTLVFFILALVFFILALVFVLIYWVFLRLLGVGR